MPEFLSKLIKKYRFFIVRKSVIDKDANIIYQRARRKYLVIGREIERIEFLRYTRDKLSDAKWREFANHFDFEALDKKYPINPLLVKQHEQKNSSF